MNIRLSPRHLQALKTAAAESGLRPGELVTQWVEERLDAVRSGQPAAPSGLAQRLDELAARVAALEAGGPSGAAQPSAGVVESQAAEDAPAAAMVEEAPVVAPKRRGRPPKSATARRPAATPPGGRRVPLHEEIIAVIKERGPQTAAELASAITERGVFQPPRSGKGLDAATVNSRVSNPVYRARFRRIGHQIALAE